MLTLSSAYSGNDSVHQPTMLGRALSTSCAERGLHGRRTSDPTYWCISANAHTIRTRPSSRSGQRFFAFGLRCRRNSFGGPNSKVADFERSVREHLRSVIQSLDLHSTNAFSSPGIGALRGTLRVRVLDCDATFMIGDKVQRMCEIGALGATIGRGNDADIRLVGEATKQVGRRHLLVLAAGRQWTVADCRSTNGTFEEDRASGSWRRLPTDVAVPIDDGMLLSLGNELFLRFELDIVPSPGE